VKTFFLREIAFIAAPFLMLTRFKDLMTQALAVIFSVLLFVALSKTLLTLVLYPVDWEAWIGVVLGSGISAFLALLVIAFLM
jgi:hypothetical protein